MRDVKLLRKNYMKDLQFKVDLLSVLPTDILYAALGDAAVYLRFNRILRLNRMFEFTERTETRTNYPNLFRIINLIITILVIIHWNASLYFQMSAWIGFGSDRWVYFNLTDPEFPLNKTLSKMYFYSYYWSTLTLTTIGETPKPVQDSEYIFVVADFLMGLLIFATIVGNVGGMITNMTASKTAFQQKMDRLKQYMELRKLDKDLQGRVIKWNEYLWNSKQSSNDDDILATLSDKLKAEIGINVHLDTLKQVAIFKDCEPGLLTDLILKLKLSVFSPGDYICRTGDIGKEMYIVKKGKLHVVATDGITVYATLAEGSVFGETSLLNIAGNKNGNRRTANIRSVGYSDLFVLSKDDLWDALSEYPEGKEALLTKGRQILRQQNLLDDIDEHTKIVEESDPDKTAKLELALTDMQTQFRSLLGEFRNIQEKLAKCVTKLDDTVILGGVHDDPLTTTSKASVPSSATYMPRID